MLRTFMWPSAWNATTQSIRLSVCDVVVFTTIYSARDGNSRRNAADAMRFDASCVRYRGKSSTEKSFTAHGTRHERGRWVRVCRVCRVLYVCVSVVRRCTLAGCNAMHTEGACRTNATRTHAQRVRTNAMQCVRYVYVYEYKLSAVNYGEKILLLLLVEQRRYVCIHASRYAEATTTMSARYA